MQLPGDEEDTVQAKVVWKRNMAGGKRASQWFKAGAKPDEKLSYDAKKYLKFYSRELLRSSGEVEE